jgi:transposase-like protein
LSNAIREFVEPGSILRTDGWSGYTTIKKYGYVHEVVRKDAQIGDDLLPYCHRIASLLKRWFMGTLQGAVSSDHLRYYLDEFKFRFNRRTSNSRGKLFYRLVQQATMVDPAPVKTLTKIIRGKRHALEN